MEMEGYNDTNWGLLQLEWKGKTVQKDCYF